MKQATGVVCKAVGGEFSVWVEGELVRCTARGVLRNQNTAVLAGDKVKLSIAEDNSGQITEVLPRVNQLRRPKTANVEQLLFVISADDPPPNFYILDSLLAVVEYLEITPLLAVTKTDLQSSEEIEAAYRQTGYPIYIFPPENTPVLCELYAQLVGKYTAVAGNTGVGKSTLLNRMNPNLQLATGETSKKLGRGKHTTRHTELFPLPEGGFIADTPGFSSVELLQYHPIPKEELALCFPEMREYLGHCRFLDCTHRTEPDCAVRQALKEQKIPESRYQSYCALYEQVSQYRAWEDK